MNSRVRQTAVIRSLSGLAALPLLLAGCQSTPSRLTETLETVRESTAALPDKPYRDVLTVQTAEERACASSDEIASLAAAVNVAAEERLAAHDWQDPELRLAYGENTEDTTRNQFTSSGFANLPAVGSEQSVGMITDDTTEYGLALRLFPPNPWTQSRVLSAGEARTQAAVAELLAAQWTLVNDVRRRFAEIDHLDADLRLLNDLTALYSNAVATIDARAAQGESTLENVLTASRRYLGALSEKDKTTRDRDQAKRELAALVAVSTDDLMISVEPDAFSQPELSEADIDALEATALKYRRDLASLYWQTRAAWFDYREARTERWPWFTFVEASFGSSDTSSERHFTSTDPTGLDPTETADAVDNGDEEAWQIATGITLPILPGKNHEPRIRLAEYRRAELQEERAKARIKREIRETLGAVHAITRSHDMIRRESEPILEQMQSGLERLESTSGLAPEDAVRIREQILEAQRLQLSSVLEYRLAVIDLEEVLGLRLNGEGGLAAGKP